MLLAGTIRLLLAGGGHTHVEVLRRLARDRDPALTTTLVSPEPAAIYSGMLPGVVAGRYGQADASIPLVPLAAAAGARWIADRIEAVDLDVREARLASGRTIGFDVLSLDVGSQPDTRVEGAREHAVPVRPIGRFLATWEETLGHADERKRYAVVGGGAGGIELLLAMQQRLNERLGARSPRWVLVTDEAHVLSSHNARVRRRIGRLLEERGVVAHTGRRVARVEAGAVVSADGRRIAADRVFWVTSAAAAPWLAASGLGTDAAGFVSVNAFLQSVTHPFVFASGDCATQVGRRYPKAGTYAVRQAPVLASNLRRHAHGRPLSRFEPPSRTLSLIATGDGRAVLSYGPWAAEGAWVWKLKDRIDRRHVARYRVEETARPGATQTPPA